MVAWPGARRFRRRRDRYLPDLRPVHRVRLDRGVTLPGVAGGRPGRAPAVCGRRLPRVPGRCPGQPPGPAAGPRRGCRGPGPQAGPAERGGAGRAAGRARARAHRGVRQLGAWLRAAAAADLGSAPSPVPGRAGHGGRDGRCGQRGMAPARLGPGPGAGPGLPPGRSRDAAARLAGRPAAAASGRAGRCRAAVPDSLACAGAVRDRRGSPAGPAVRDDPWHVMLRASGRMPLG